LAALVGLPAYGQDVVRSEQKAGLVQTPDEYNVGAFNDLGIITLKSKDGRFSWSTDIRMYIDAAGYWNDKQGNKLSNGMSIEEFRLALNFQWDKNWIAQVDLEFDPGDSWQFQDMYVGYIGFANSMIRLGENKIPYGMENLTSERYIAFANRPMYVDPFKGGRRIGITYNRWGERYSLEAGAYTAGANDVNEPTGEDQANRYAARITFAPVLTKDAVLHIGAGGFYGTPKAGSGDTASYKSGVETGMTAGNWMTTGKITNVDHQEHYNFEAAGRYKGLWFQAEYGLAKVKRFGGLVNPSFNGWYAEVGWFPSGYRNPYNVEVGEFGRVIPTNNKGLFEILARYSKLDLNDLNAGYKGGNAHTTTLGVNYFMGYNTRVMADFAYVKTDEYAKGDRPFIPNDSFYMVNARFQLAF
jgi:phosphate-selective porin OprO/OprP